MIKHRNTDFNNRITYQIHNNQYIFIKNFFQNNYLGQGFTYQKFINQKMVHTIISDNILWNKKKKEYFLLNYQERYLHYHKNQEVVKRGSLLNYNFFIHPRQFVDKNFLPENLTTNELQKFIEYEKKRGIKKLNLYFNELYQRSSLPFSAFILTILAFLLSSIKNDSNDIGKNIVLGIIIAFFYIFLIELFKSMSINDDHSSIFIISIPNIIFSIIVLLFLLIRNQK